jgi:hypothetical protein
VKYFHSGFLFTCGCILAILLTWLVTQFFVRLKLQEIYYQRQPRVRHVQWQIEHGRVASPISALSAGGPVTATISS